MTQTRGAEIILIYWGCHWAWFNTHFLIMLLEWTFIYFYILSKSNLRAALGSLILKWLMSEWHAQLILLPSVLKINNQFYFIPVRVGHGWGSSPFSEKKNKISVLEVEVLWANAFHYCICFGCWMLVHHDLRRSRNLSQYLWYSYFCF